MDVMTVGAAPANRADRVAMIRRGRRLQYVTIAWNSLECAVALVAGVLAGSIALVGFGFDSAIEVTSSVAALWRLAWDRDDAHREVAERRTFRLIGVCFLLLSVAGIVLAALSLIVMPVLARSKRQIASRLGSGALEAETRQTEICAYLSAILLAGLGLNAWLGCWWADPLAGLVMVPLIAWEGLAAVRGRTCCADLFADT